MAYNVAARTAPPPEQKRGSVLKRIASNLAEGKDGSESEFVGHDDAASRAGRSLFWEQVWGEGIAAGTIFDNGGPCRALESLLEQEIVVPSGTALVPGCGRGYDCVLLKRYGFERVVGVELAASAVKAAKLECGDAVDIVQANFFEYDDPADLVFDCTFLCALHPASRRAWAARTSRLVKPGGHLVSIVFPLALSPTAKFVQFIRYYLAGPPYSLTVDLIKHLLEPHDFDLVHVKDPLPPDLRHLPKNPLGFQTAVVVFRKKCPSPLAPSLSTVRDDIEANDD